MRFSYILLFVSIFPRSGFTVDVEHKCIVPLSPEDNENDFVVNDYSDGFTKVRVNITKLETSIDTAGVDHERKMSLKVHVDVLNYEDKWQQTCISIWGAGKTQVEECMKQQVDNKVIWNLEMPMFNGEIFVNAFVKSTASNYALSISARQVSLPKLENGDYAKECEEKLLKPMSDKNISVDIFIMSKDRPFEVEALLDSIHRLCTGWRNIVVLHLGTSDCSRKAYTSCASRYPHVRFVKQEISSFRQQLLKHVSESSATHVIPMVGEMVFIRPFDMKNAAFILEKTSPYGTFHPRLGTQLDLYSVLKSIFGSSFSSQSQIDPSIFSFDATVAQQNFCHKGFTNLTDNEWLLNDFWWIHHLANFLGGPILRRDNLLDAWNTIRFSHPGNLEVNWGYAARGRAGGIHLMPKYSVLVSNDNAAPTRVDHVANAQPGKLNAWEASRQRECELIYNQNCLPDVQQLVTKAKTDLTFPEQVRTYFDMLKHCH